MGKLQRLLARLGEPPTPSRRGRRNTLDELDRARAEFVSPPYCPACNARDGIDRSQLELVGAALAVPAVRERYEHSHGLCVRHAVRLPDGQGSRLARRHLDARLGVLAWEVHETARNTRGHTGTRPPVRNATPGPGHSHRSTGGCSAAGRRRRASLDRNLRTSRRGGGGGACRRRCRRGRASGGRQAGRAPARAVRTPARRARSDRGVSRPGQDADRPIVRDRDRGALLARAVHPGRDALGRDRRVDLQPAHGGVRVPARAGVHERPARGRDQSRPAEDPGGAARGDAGAPGDDRRSHAAARPAVPGAGDPEPDRVRGHVPAAGGPNSNAS